MKNLEEKVVEILRIHKDEKLTASEISQYIFKLYPNIEEIYNVQVSKHNSKISGLSQCSAEIDQNTTNQKHS